MRVKISCKRCGLNRDVIGRGTCRPCGSHHVYKPAPRIRKIDCRKFARVFVWSQDERGPDIVHVDNGETITQERGIWTLVQSDWLEFPKVDGRKTARPYFRWMRTGTRFEE